MDSLRRAAREYLKKADGDNIPDFSPGQTTLPDGLDPLWRDVLKHDSSKHQEACENLLAVQAFLRSWGPKTLSEDDVEAANAIYSWAAEISLPSSEFAEVLEGAYSADEEKKKPLTDSLKDSRLRLSLGVSVIRYLNAFLPIQEAENTVDIVTTLASFTSEKDPWTTKWAREQAVATLASYVSARRSENVDALWTVLEEILKSKLKPLFAKTNHPAITPAGRKDFHPIPHPRFDSGMLDPETKPWKFQEVYSTTVLAWIVSQYLILRKPSDCSPLEAHFPLLVPPILALIDDENLSFKTRGCDILSQVLVPLREGKSDILRRTNLSSVFEDAVTPCFLSLPTITPENESIQLLKSAYPALLSVLKTRYPNASASPDTRSSSSHRTLSAQEDKEGHLRGVTSMLRTSLIPSFHHISSTTPTIDKSIASFPYPRLSTLLLDQMYTLVLELGIHATKYLQDMVPLLYTTLTNPFGTAHPPLLLAAVAATRAVVLNAHPRIWRWRGELLGALCECWLYVLEEEKQIAERMERDRKRGRDILKTDLEGMSAMEKLKRQLKGAVYLLKVAVNSIAQSSKVEASSPEENWAGLDAEVDMEKELEELVKADESLRGLLFADFSPDDDEYF